MTITVKAKPVRKTRMRCSSCGSEDVFTHASCYWDYDKQEWRFNEFMDGYDDWCDHCDSETVIEDNWEYEEPPTWPPSS